jgi:hypothetical protein
MEKFISISEFLKWVGTNPWLSIMSFALAVLGIALAIIFYFKSKKVKKPCYAILSTNILKEMVSKIESLSILYSGEQISNLTVSKIAFWNAGRDIINSQDIAQLDQLKIQVTDNYKILNAQINYEKNKANNFKISIDNSQRYINLNFEYLGKDDGVIIQILHTGLSNKDIYIVGTIKGADKLLQKQIILPIKVMTKVDLFIFLPFLILAPIVSFLFVFKYDKGFIVWPLYKQILGSLSLFVFWGVAFRIYWRGIPKGLEAIGKEFP